MCSVSYYLMYLLKWSCFTIFPRPILKPSRVIKMVNLPFCLYRQHTFKPFFIFSGHLVTSPSRKKYHYLHIWLRWRVDKSTTWDGDEMGFFVVFRYFCCDDWVLNGDRAWLFIIHKRWIDTANIFCVKIFKGWKRGIRNVFSRR